MYLLEKPVEKMFALNDTIKKKFNLIEEQKVRDAIDKIIPPHCKCDELCKSVEDLNEILKKELKL